MFLRFFRKKRIIRRSLYYSEYSKGSCSHQEKRKCFRPRALSPYVKSYYSASENTVTTIYKKSKDKDKDKDLEGKTSKFLIRLSEQFFKIKNPSSDSLNTKTQYK